MLCSSIVSTVTGDMHVFSIEWAMNLSLLPSDPAQYAPKDFCQMGCVNGDCIADHGTFKCRYNIY